MPPGRLGREAGGETLPVVRKSVVSSGGRGVSRSRCSHTPSSDVSDEEDAIDSSSDSSDPDAVEGAYSCLRGEEERRSSRRPMRDVGCGWSFKNGAGLARSC